MRVVTKAKQAVAHDESLEQVKQRFALWRGDRKRGERISNALWAAALCMVERHGLERTARELRVDYDMLRKRLERTAGPAQAGKREIQFVEMFAPSELSAVSTSGCIVEMENARGGKMRVDLKSLDGLAGLCSAFWSAR